MSATVIPFRRPDTLETITADLRSAERERDAALQLIEDAAPGTAVEQVARKRLWHANQRMNRLIGLVLARVENARLG